MTLSGHRSRTRAIVDQIGRRSKREIVKHVESREVLDQAAVDRIERLEKRLASFQDSQQFVLPRAFAELIERVARLEQIDITPAEPAELQENINELGRELADMSGAILRHIVTLQKRADAQDARFAELPNVLAELQRERRKA
jgi:uncharacterized protein (UPF0335 family)